MASLQDLLGGGLPAGLLDAEQMQAAEQRARNAGLLNLAFGLLQASQGQPGQRKPGLGQIIGQAGPVGVQGYQQSFDKTLQDTIRGMQISEMRQKQADAARMRQAQQTFQERLAAATKMQPTMQGVLDTQSNIDPAELEGMSAQQVIGMAPKTQQVTDQAAANQAVMDYLRVADPTEYAKLISREQPESFRLLTQEEAKSQGLPPGNYQVSSKTGKISPVGREQTVVNVSTGDKKLVETLGTEGAKRLTASLTAAEEATTTIARIQELRPVLKEGVFSGPLSSAPRVVTQIASQLGITGKDTNELLQRTAVAMQGLASFELSAAAAMRGQGAITENERMLIQRAAAGRLDQFTAAEIQALLDTMEKTAKYRISSHNRQLDVLRRSKSPEVQEMVPLFELQPGVISAPPASTGGVRKFNPATGRVE